MNRWVDLDDDRHCFCGDDGEYEKWNIDPEAIKEGGQMNNAVGLHVLEDLRKRLEERILTELDNNRKLDARTVGICLGITHNVIDEMMEDDEEE